MNSSISLNRNAQNYLNSLDAKQFKQIGKKIFSLIVETNQSDIRHLSGYPGFFRTTIGEHRIIFCKKNEVTEIVEIGKRNDDEVYRNFQRGSH